MENNITDETCSPY